MNPITNFLQMMSFHWFFRRDRSEYNKNNDKFVDRSDCIFWSTEEFNLLFFDRAYKWGTFINKIKGRYWVWSNKMELTYEKTMMQSDLSTNLSLFLLYSDLSLLKNQWNDIICKKLVIGFMITFNFSLVELINEGLSLIE